MIHLPLSNRGHNSIFWLMNETCKKKVLKRRPFVEGAYSLNRDSGFRCTGQKLCMKQKESTGIINQQKPFKQHRRVGASCHSTVMAVLSIIYNSSKWGRYFLWARSISLSSSARQELGMCSTSFESVESWVKKAASVFITWWQ